MRSKAAAFFSSLALAGLSALCFDAGAAAAEAADPTEARGSAPRRPASPTVLPGAAVAGIKVYFKLDPLLTRGLYLGERWVSPPTYTSALQEGEQATVEARAEGQDTRRRRLVKYLSAEWLPADPAMVRVSPGPANVVKITVQKPGESTVQVRFGEVSRTLIIKATYRDRENGTQVEISQQ